MSEMKFEVKLGTLHEVDGIVQDLQASSSKQESVLEGSASAFLQAAGFAKDLMKKVDEGVDKEEISPETAQVTKQFLLEYSKILGRHAEQSVSLKLRQRGSSQALDLVTSRIQKIRDSETSKHKALLQTLESKKNGKPVRRTTGTRPEQVGRTRKQARG